MRQIQFLIFITICVCAVSAQSISLYFPHFSGVEYDFYLFQGVKSDTVQRGVIGTDGNLTLTVPEQYKGYKGVSRWMLRNSGGLDFVITGNDFSVSCTESQPNDNNIIYKGSPDNDFIVQLYSIQRHLQEKLRVMQAIQHLYQTSPLSDIYQAAERELKLLNETYRELHLELLSSPLYAARYLRISDFANNTLPNTGGDPKVELLRFVTEELNLDVLFTSGLWRNVIRQFPDLYANGDDFISAMIIKLQQTVSLTVYEQFAESLIVICEQRVWHDQETQLVYFLINDGRIKNPAGRLKQAMTLYKLVKGSKAPSLSQGELPSSKTLLVFHESGCGNCTKMLSQLKENYSQLQNNGYDVVSISGSVDLSAFEQESKAFPWKSKYCDGKGFSGEDIQNYGIIGTPTIFILDEKGIIQGRYARLEDALKN